MHSNERNVVRRGREGETNLLVELLLKREKKYEGREEVEISDASDGKEVRD